MSCPYIIEGCGGYIALRLKGRQRQQSSKHYDGDRSSTEEDCEGDKWKDCPGYRNRKEEEKEDI